MADFPAPADAVTEYAARAGWPAARTPAPRPETLAMPLRARVEALLSGELDAGTWRDEESRWTDHADARYRACVHRAAADAGTPPVRVGVKDTVDVAGFPTGLGLRFHRHHARASTPAVAGLPGRYAAVTAKVATTELNIGVGSGCLNPYAPHIDPGGSSTGTAVSVAAGICDIALGTDVLGSVRWPAGQCGTVGLRTTHDPALLDGVFPLSPPMDALGWVTRTADDLGYLWPLLGLDRLGPRQPAPGTPRIGVVAEVDGPDGTCGPVMRGALETALAHLESAGHRTAEVRLGELWEMRGPAWELCGRQAWDAYQLWRPWLNTELHETTRTALEVGAKVGDDRYAWILERLHACRRAADALFDSTGTDVWLLPLDPCPPPDVAAAGAKTSTIPSPGDPDYDRRVAYTPVASFTGLPALTLPVARDERGAPLCVQLVGRRHGERTLIGLARRLESAVGDLGFRPS
ncbi:amidase [Streptomyces huiliensis]|uniref:amidase n=1 Tax=Streptomyces huiliensis TaxID=2876027 RepID=UPI001CBD55EA|nr:amidase [Streptomyces huiliensis]MBZ4322011.1 amidase [Streptomyces huiliensis]